MKGIVLLLTASTLAFAAQAQPSSESSAEVVPAAVHRPMSYRFDDAMFEAIEADALDAAAQRGMQLFSRDGPTAADATWRITCRISG